MNGPSIMQAARHWSHTNGRGAFRRSDQLREHAARVVQLAHTRGAKVYAPLLTAQKLSEGRKRGGSLGDVAVDMLAMAKAGDVQGVELYLTYVQGVRDALLTEPGCPKDLTMQEQEVNAAEDAASLSYVAGGCAVKLKEAVRGILSINRRRYAALLRETVER